MPADFDPNVWYHISEERVDKVGSRLSHTLQTTPNGLRVFHLVSQAWQMHPVDDEPGRFVMRLNTSGVGSHLAACHDPDELAASRTVACLERASLHDSHKWYIEDWGDGGYKISNVANGSDTVLDVHPGSNLFLNDQVEGDSSDARHPAQHWIFSSAREINDGAWSTIHAGATASSVASPTPSSSGDSTAATASNDASDTTSSDVTSGLTSLSGTPTPSASTDALSSPSSSSSSSSSASSGLTAGAAAGIAVGATLGVIALVAGLGFIWWRRRRAKKQALAGLGDASGSSPPAPTNAEKDAALLWAAEQARKAGLTTQEAPTTQIHEAPNLYSELDANSAAQSAVNSPQNTPTPTYAPMRYTGE
ncbi:hypothetical protein ACRALDRAFT_1071467 [Sodiomyces alcalophilus JCM 7366]|uniref:uncharacterized protein n=1 Tax=Sodiomyces alcalophilus JCM 7366 TaxID=591952 RepID=UPI0039B3F677